MCMATSSRQVKLVISVIFKLANGTKSAHSISGYMCDDEYYLYNSNSVKFHKIDWHDLANVNLFFINNPEYKYMFEIRVMLYDYACYILK